MIDKINEALVKIDRSGLKRPYLNQKFSVSHDDIKKAEIKLGMKFPDSYRFFLKTLGSGDFQGIEFYGLVPGNINLKEIPNALWFTQEMHINDGLPTYLFAFQDFDGDAVACLMLSEMKDSECPVILWEHGESQDRQLRKPHILANSFGEYFFSKIKELI